MIKSFPCFAPQGQKQGKTELFMVAGLREMQENQGLSENQIDKLEFNEEIYMDKKKDFLLSVVGLAILLVGTVIVSVMDYPLGVIAYSSVCNSTHC